MRRDVEASVLCENAAGERFFGLLKRERIYCTRYLTREAGGDDAFETIEPRHNPRMRRKQAKQDLKFSTLSKPSVISGNSPSDELCAGIELQLKTNAPFRQRPQQSAA